MMWQGVRVFLGALFCVCLVWAQAKLPDRKLQPGDRVQVVCIEEPGLCVVRTVSASGSIFLDGVGSVVAAGRTLTGLQNALIEALAEVEDGRRLHLKLTAVSSPKAAIRVSGMVQESIEVLPLPKATLQDLLAIAKPTPAADLSNVLILSADGREWAVDADGKPFQLRGGDRITVLAKRGGEDVSLLGGVAKPGAIPYAKGITLLKAIAEAGGLTARANSAKILLARFGENIPLQIPGDEGFELRKGDIVRVTINRDVSYVSVGGWVLKPGLVEFRAGMKLTQAIEAAGGLTGRASQWVHIKSLTQMNRRDLRVNLMLIAAGKTVEPVLLAGESVEIEGR